MSKHSQAYLDQLLEMDKRAIDALIAKSLGWHTRPSSKNAQLVEMVNADGKVIGTPVFADKEAILWLLYAPEFTRNVQLCYESLKLPSDYGYDIGVHQFIDTVSIVDIETGNPAQNPVIKFSYPSDVRHLSEEWSLAWLLFCEWQERISQRDTA